MTSCKMAQSAVLQPPGPFHLSGGGGNGYRQARPQYLASVLRHVVVDQNGNNNPSHHTVLLLGDPDAVSTIKQLRKLQSVEMHDLRERWGDLLQAASDHDESAMFQ